MLTASRGTEYSFEGDPVPDARQPESIFTEALVSGIRSGAADSDRDGYISVDDAYTYAFDRVREAGAQQTPQRWLYGAEGDIVLARSPVSAAAPLPRPEPPRAAPAPSVVTTHEAALHRRPRWQYGLAALVTVAAVGAVASALWSNGQDPARSGGSSLPSGSVSTAPGQAIVASAPWRVSVDASDAGGGGCEVTLTNDETAATTQLPVVWGTASYQMHESGTFTWSARHPACVVIPQPGAAITKLPLLVPQPAGDTPAFEVDGPVEVQVSDFQGNDTCDIGLRTVSDGRLVAQHEVAPADATVLLDPLGESPVYISGHACGFRVTDGS